MFATRPDTALLRPAALLLAVALCAGLALPEAFPAALLAALGVGIAVLAYRHTTGFSVAWLLIAGMSLEMALNDLSSPDAYQPAIAVIKTISICLACLCALRCGPRLDPLNPAWIYCVMMAAGEVHGLHPGLTTADSLRSFLGSTAPFGFSFCRKPRNWGTAMVRAVTWCPVVAIAACLPLAILGIRPLFVDSGGARLAGLGHPAFLANVCLPAIYACLIRLYRHGKRADLLLLGANFLILLLTGARAPFAYALAVTGFSIVSIRSTVFAVHCRMLLLLIGATILPLLLLFASDFADIRLFNVLTTAADNLSGRTLLWPEFEAAAAQSPWFGWGIGAGNAVIPPDGKIVQILHTWAAHNEYLRMQVEGGRLGLGLLILSFAAWVFVHTRALPASDRRIMRLAFVAFACHAFTDNVLISTPACVLFAFAAAVFDGGTSAETGLALPGSGRRA